MTPRILCPRVKWHTLTPSHTIEIDQREYGSIHKTLNKLKELYKVVPHGVLWNSEIWLMTPFVGDRQRPWLAYRLVSIGLTHAADYQFLGTFTSQVQCMQALQTL